MPSADTLERAAAGNRGTVPAGVRWSAEQYRNAQIIASVGRSLGASDRDITIALMAAMVESGMRNLDYGDRDSIGMFQQRNAWGSRAARLDPHQSARMFFLGGMSGQRGLLDFRNRDRMGLGQAAQAVQVSAFPDRYQQRLGDATELIRSISGRAPRLAAPTPATAGRTTTTTLPPMFPVEPPKPPDPVAAPTPLGIGAANEDVLAANAADEPNELPQLPNLSRDQFAELFPQGTGTTLAGGKAAGGVRGEIVAAAMGWLGVPYAWGGNSRSGVDCSGLLQQLFKPFGINLPRVSYQQAGYGKRVGLDALLPGDLVAIDNSPRNNGADHVALWAGDGYIIEAPRPGLAVRKRKIGANEGGWYGVQLTI